MPGKKGEKSQSLHLSLGPIRLALMRLLSMGISEDGMTHQRRSEYIRGEYYEKTKISNLRLNQRFKNQPDEIEYKDTKCIKTKKKYLSSLNFCHFTAYQP